MNVEISYFMWFSIKVNTFLCSMLCYIMLPRFLTCFLCLGLHWQHITMIIMWAFESIPDNKHVTGYYTTRMYVCMYIFLYIFFINNYIFGYLKIGVFFFLFIYFLTISIALVLMKKDVNCILYTETVKLY